MFVGAMGILRGKLHPDFLQRLGVVPREPIREIAKTLQTQCGPNTKILHYSGKTLLPIREVYYREHSSQFLVKPDSKKHTELLEYNNPAVWEIADLVPAEISKFNSEKILCLVSYSWIGHDEDNDVRKWLYNNYNMVFSRKIGNGFVEKFNKKE